MIKITSNKLRWAFSAFFSLLILFGTYRNVFSLAAFLGCCLMIFFCDKESILYQLFFIMPMANIFKLAPGVQSFFTILILLYVILHLVLPRRATSLVVLFGVYLVVTQLFTANFNLFRTVKLVCNILFLSSILNTEVKLRHREIFMSYIVGNIVSSVFGLMDSNIFKIESYVGTVELGISEFGEDTVRFVGLYTDPNYYAVGLIISLCLLVVLFHRNEINAFAAAVFTVPMIYFLIITYSKSAIIMLFIPFIMLLYSLLQRKSFITAIIFMLLSVVVVYLALTGRIPALEIVLSRIFESGSSGDLNQLTTGRLNLWLMYAKYIVNDIRIFLFGKGLGAGFLNGRAAHNTYLDIFYYFGMFGGTLLITSLFTISKQSRQGFKRKKNLLNYSVLICILLMYFFLSEVLYFDPPFHIILSFLVLNLPFTAENDEEKDNNMENCDEKSINCV